MSMIFINKITLKNNAIVVLNNKKGKEEIVKKGDFTIIKVDNKVVGVNIQNYEKYFLAKEGQHNLSDEQIKVLNEHQIEVPVKSYFVVGEVIERKVHPKSEKLFILKVKTDKELQIVTNSLNSTVGNKVVVAKPGATLLSGFPIIKSKVMGVESEGMLCGGETLGKEKTEGVLLVNELEINKPYII